MRVQHLLVADRLRKIAMTDETNPNGRSIDYVELTLNEYAELAMTVMVPRKPPTDLRVYGLNIRVVN